MSVIKSFVNKSPNFTDYIPTKDKNFGLCLLNLNKLYSFSDLEDMLSILITSGRDELYYCNFRYNSCIELENFCAALENLKKFMFDFLIPTLREFYNLNPNCEDIKLLYNTYKNALKKHNYKNENNVKTDDVKFILDVLIGLDMPTLKKLCSYFFNKKIKQIQVLLKKY